MIVTVTIKGDKYALINYEEIIRYYKQPFYKKWFNNPPVQELIEIKDNKVIEDYHNIEHIKKKDPNICLVCDAIIPITNNTESCDNCGNWYFRI